MTSKSLALVLFLIYCQFETQYVDAQFGLGNLDVVSDLLGVDVGDVTGNIPLIGQKSEKPKKSDKAAAGSRAIFGEKKKGGGISGFLGMDETLETIENNASRRVHRLQNVLNPVIQLRKAIRIPGINDKNESECGRTYFMGPYSKIVTFSANGSIGSRTEPTCKWNFIGTEPCIPLLSCEEFDLLGEDGKCTKDTFEVRDGNVGHETFCGKIGPRNISAQGGLRDLFIKYKAHGAGQDTAQKFKCTVMCSSRHTGIPLKQSFQPSTNNLCQCGRRPNVDRIVNGENATKHEFPWLAALVKDQTRQPFCGASIINNRFLVTAAHCFKGDFLQVSNLDIVLGGHILDVTPNFAVLNQSSRPPPQTYDAPTLLELDSGNGSVRFDIDEVIIHPLYVAQTNDFDVALIKLAGTIDFNKYPQLSPVCLPKLGSYLRTYAKGMAIVAGWGLGGAEAIGTNSLLQKLNMTVFTPKECKETYAHRVSRRMLCAGYIQGGRDSCMGDSGGPLVLEDKPHLWYQIGTVSWGEGCAESNSPGAYIRMTEVGQWLHYHSNMHEAEWCEVKE